MKISQLAAATLIPATAAGVALTAMPFAQASPAPTTRHAAHHVVHHAATAKTVTQAKGSKSAAKPAKPSARPAALPAATHAAAQPAATQAPAQPAQAQPASSQPVNAGMSSFEACVAWRESGNNPTASSAGLFGILPATWHQLGYSGTAGQASVAQQKVAFQRLYAQYGTSPWAPYDGC
jgi:resuscitation-promoting factor RpfC